MTETQFQIEKPSDLDKLKEIARAILGEVCWKPHLTYGDELRLEIGARLPPRKGGRNLIEQGAWMLGSRATAWKLLSPDGILVTSDDEPELVVEKIQAIKNTRIVSFEINFPDLALTVTFGNSHKLMITPTAEDDATDLAYWELFTPEGIVKVGPGAAWTYISSSS